MLGFAIVDRQPNANATAVWHTCREDSVRVRHTNAAVVRHEEEDHEAKLYALTANRAVVLTSGSTPPLDFANALQVRDFDLLVDETTRQQGRITAAIADYAVRTKNKNLVMPSFALIRRQDRGDMGDQPQDRALAAANYIADVWSAWLLTEEQRVRRTLEPRTGKGPWIMPPELDAPVVAPFPAGFGERVQPERHS